MCYEHFFSFYDSLYIAPHKNPLESVLKPLKAYLFYLPLYIVKSRHSGSIRSEFVSLWIWTQKKACKNRLNFNHSESGSMQMIIHIVNAFIPTSSTV